LAHNIDIALPCELTLEQNIFLARDYVREQFTRKGYAVDWAIHSPDPRGDDRNIHLHVLVPQRKIEGDSFGKKTNCTSRQLGQQVKAWRQSWATLANRHLKRYGHKDTIDERSLRAQGHKRAPTRHQGPQPKSSRYALNTLRAKLPPQPLAPIMRITKQIGADGSIRIQAVITNTALTNIRTGGKAAPVVTPDRKGWPEAAVIAWESWGSKNPPLFFRIWSELAPAGYVAGEGPRP
jgi:ATP-dependent exoDNAse (exonuclease V) alpha subunit